MQKTTNIDKDGNEKIETWYEAMSLRGSLRIDFTPTKDGNGILFTKPQRHGEVTESQRLIIRTAIK